MCIQIAIRFSGASNRVTQVFRAPRTGQTHLHCSANAIYSTYCRTRWRDLRDENRGNFPRFPWKSGTLLFRFIKNELCFSFKNRRQSLFFCILPATPVEKYVEVHFHVWLQHRQMLSMFCHWETISVSPQHFHTMLHMTMLKDKAGVI